MAQSPSKINAISAEHSEVSNPATKTRYLNIKTRFYMSGLSIEPSSYVKILKRCPLRVFPRSSVNDAVADPSYTGNRNVKDFDQGLRIVDRNALVTAIPRWATWLFASGNVLALASIIALCITRNSHFLLVIAAGLLMAANGLRASERAITDVQ